MEASVSKCGAFIKISTIFEDFYREIEAVSRIARLFKYIFSEKEPFFYINLLLSRNFWPPFAPDHQSLMIPLNQKENLIFPSIFFRYIVHGNVLLPQIVGKKSHLITYLTNA
jgi:hypothetical protein